MSTALEVYSSINRVKCVPDAEYAENNDVRVSPETLDQLKCTAQQLWNLARENGDENIFPGFETYFETYADQHCLKIIQRNSDDKSDRALQALIIFRGPRDEMSIQECTYYPSRVEDNIYGSKAVIKVWPLSLDEGPFAVEETRRGLVSKEAIPLQREVKRLGFMSERQGENLIKSLKEIEDSRFKILSPRKRLGHFLGIGSHQY